MGTICELFLEREKTTLSKYAFLTANTRGREHPYTPSDMRTEFQRDRDRIIHSQSFRRLMNKTQVFLAPTGDHYRTRLTHTLEVTQIARIIARALRLNEDLTVPPLPALFPHAETVLREAMARGCKNYIYTNRGKFLFQYLEQQKDLKILILKLHQKLELLVFQIQNIIVILTIFHTQANTQFYPTLEEQKCQKI